MTTISDVASSAQPEVGGTVVQLQYRSCEVKRQTKIHTMVTDVQLAIFANMLGVSLFLLVVLYHYVAVNNPKKMD
ncbi:unnamed protein product [Gadus morhua 'NCC']